MIFSRKRIWAAVGLLAASWINATAQPAVVTVTNYVTVVVTNVVTITNIVTSSLPLAATITGPFMQPVKPKSPWQKSVSAGLTLTRGNSDTLLFSAEFLTQKKTAANEYLLGLGGSYGTQNSSETVNNCKGFGQWNHLYHQDLYGYARADALSDQIANIDYRFTIGPGVGYFLIKDTNTFLATEAGAGFEDQRLGGADQTFATIRLAERFEHRVNDRARIWENVELLPQIDKLDNYIVNFQIGLETYITKTLSLKTYLNDSYQNQPAKGKENNDAKIMAAVAYKF